MPQNLHAGRHAETALRDPVDDPGRVAPDDVWTGTIRGGPEVVTALHSPRERIVRAILDGLYEGRYHPGDRLIEARLTEEYGASRGPVREALNRLSAMGVVSLTMQRGAEIRRLSLAEAIDVLVVVQNLVGLAAQLAAERIHLPGGAEQLRNALQRLETAEVRGDSSRYGAARENFYATLHQIGGNRELSRAMSGMQSHLVRSQFSRTMAALDRSRQADYRQIAAHVLEGKAAQARAAARNHIGRVITLLSKSRAS
jgi:DNA-binding GntR family transcriptional regulator